MRRFIATGIVILMLGAWSERADATRNFTGVQTPAPNAPVTMGTTGTLTYRITNSNTSPNTGERIYEVRFRMSSGRSTFSSTVAAPTGWTRTAYSTTSVTFRANSWANCIVTGSYLDFPVIFNFRQTTADTNELLRDIRARNTTSTGGPPFTLLGSDTDSNQGGWTLKSLTATFQITDTSGTPITSLVAGNSYRVVMTVTNRSTTTQSSIVSVGSSNPGPPIQNTPAPGFTGTLPSPSAPAYSPNPLTLAAGASGTITYTYTTVSTAYGSVYYTAYARNNTSTATSTTATSPTLYIGLLTATISVTPSLCRYSGDSFSVQMLLTNRYAFDITGVTPAMTVSLVGAPLTLTSGPVFTPSSTTVTGNGGTLTVTWGYQVTAAASGQSFTFDGSAAGTGSGQPRSTSASSLLAKAGGYLVSANQTNGSSTNDEISWTFTNNGCAATDSVRIDIDTASGWVWGGGSEDTYSFVDTGAATSVETWTPSGSDPVTFTAPAAADRQALGEDGDYRLAFSNTPTVAVSTNYTFDVRITDANGFSVTVPAMITVDPFSTGSLNDANGLIWLEEFR